MNTSIVLEKRVQGEKIWHYSNLVCVSFPHDKTTRIIHELDSQGKIKKLIWSSSLQKYDHPWDRLYYPLDIVK